MVELKLVIFDLAGTTVSDRGEIVEAFTEALKAHHVVFTPEQIRAVRGSSKRAAVLRFIPESPDRKERADLIYSTFREHLVRQTKNFEPIPGAFELFQWFRFQGVRIALTTGFERDIAETLLARLNWNDDGIDAIVFSDDVTQGRPAPFLIFKAMERTSIPSVQEVANIGDTVLDLQSAHNAGVRWNIGVLSGAQDRELLQGTPHTHILDSIADIPKLWVNGELRMKPASPVFFYGTFMDPDVLMGHGVHARALVRAKLHGFQLSIRPRANLTRSMDASVYGTIVPVTCNELNTLYSYLEEQFGLKYFPIAVIAETLEGMKQPAICYVTQEMPDSAPDREYVKQLAACIRAMGLPESYALQIERLQ